MRLTSFFLTTDPIHHSTKSSGKILAKVNRGSDSYENVLDILTFDMLSVAINALTVIVSLFAFGWQFGLATLIFVGLTATFNVVTQIIRTQTFEPKVIEKDDKVKAVSVETLQQTPFIRSIFATPEQDQKIRKVIFELMTQAANAWKSGMYVEVLTRIFYLLSILVLAFLVLESVQTGSLTPAIAISLILTYINSTKNVVHLGNQVKRLTKSLNNIQDLFDFIRNFGGQTFPVLEGEVKSEITKSK